MIGLVASGLFRLRRMRASYVVLAVVVLVSAESALILVSASHGGEAQPFGLYTMGTTIETHPLASSLSGAIGHALLGGSFLTSIVCVAASEFVCWDVRTGFRDALLSSGVSRRRYYASLLGLCWLVALVLLVLAAGVIAVVLAAGGYDFKAKDNLGDILAWGVLALLHLWLYSVLGVMGALVVRRRTGALCLSLAVGLGMAGMVVGGILKGLGGLSAQVASFVPFMHGQLLADGAATTFGQLGGYSAAALVFEPLLLVALATAGALACERWER